MISLKGRSFLTLKDFTKEEITYLIDLAAYFKKLKKERVLHDRLKGMNVALIFEKTSTRTRASFEVAANDLGMGRTYLDPKSSQIGKKESIEDTAKVLGRMFDGIEYRGFGQEIVETLAEHAGVPVWNGLTNEYHPTQILADMLTIREYMGELKGKTLVYLGDAKYNMGNSLMIGCSKLGLNFRAIAPSKYFPDEKLVKQCSKWAEDADAVYTDVWVSMGEPDSVWEERIEDLTPYRVTMDVMKLAKENAIFMHCLPSFHDLDTEIGREINQKFGLTCMEVTDEVFKAYNKPVFDEAGNRMHTIKAVMAATLSDDWEI